MNTTTTQDLIKRNIDISKLPPQIRSSIQAFQQDNHAATKGNILTAYDALDYYLTWEGIIRYTDNLINLFVTVIDAVAAEAETPKTVFRVNPVTEVEPRGLETFYVTYGWGSKLAGKYSIVQLHNYTMARAYVNEITKGEFAFIYDQADFQGQIKRHGLEEVELQPQGPCE